MWGPVGSVRVLQKQICNHPSALEPQAAHPEAVHGESVPTQGLSHPENQHMQLEGGSPYSTLALSRDEQHEPAGLSPQYLAPKS